MGKQTNNLISWKTENISMILCKCYALSKLLGILFPKTIFEIEQSKKV